MDRNFGVRRLLILAAIVGIACGTQAMAAMDLSSLETEQSVLTSPLMDLPAEMPAEELDGGHPEAGTIAIPIAEPGSIGLMVLAGLMGGAIAMRRRLG